MIFFYPSSTPHVCYYSFKYEGGALASASGTCPHVAYVVFLSWMGCSEMNFIVLSTITNLKSYYWLSDRYLNYKKTDKNMERFFHSKFSNMLNIENINRSMFIHHMTQKPDMWDKCCWQFSCDLLWGCTGVRKHFLFWVLKSSVSTPAKPVTLCSEIDTQMLHLWCT